MKCVICQKKNKNKGYYANYCPTCGLYMGKINKKQVVERIDDMIQKWDTKKQFHYYDTIDLPDGETDIAFKYRGIKKIIDYFYSGDMVTFSEFEAMVQAISYLSIEFEYNVTSLALTLFCFASDYLGGSMKVYKYWIKRGKKEKNKDAYFWELCSFYSKETDKTRRGKRKVEKIRNIMRHMRNNED